MVDNMQIIHENIWLLMQIKTKHYIIMHDIIILSIYQSFYEN